MIMKSSARVVKVECTKDDELVVTVETTWNFWAVRKTKLRRWRGWVGAWNDAETNKPAPAWMGQLLHYAWRRWKWKEV